MSIIGSFDGEQTAVTLSSKSEIHAFGEEVARLRTRRRWSRSMLIKRLDRVLEAKGLVDYNCSEAWLHRLENGTVVKVPHQIVDALCEALQCTLREQANLLLFADRNVLRDTSSATPEVMKLFNYMMVDLYSETAQILALLTEQRTIAELSDVELYELFFAALEIVIVSRRSKTTSQG